MACGAAQALANIAAAFVLACLSAGMANGQSTSCPAEHTYPSPAASFTNIIALCVTGPMVLLFLWKLEALSQWLAFQKEKRMHDPEADETVRGTRAITAPEGVSQLDSGDYKMYLQNFSCSMSGDVSLYTDLQDNLVMFKNLSTPDSERLETQAAIFEREIRVLATIDHPNIIKLKGVVHTDALVRPPAQVLEYPIYGILWRFLREANIGANVVEPVLDGDGDGKPGGPPSVPAIVNRATMIRFAHNLSSAVAFLADQGVTHKDIAARHCFVAKDFTVKLSLFELHVSSQSWDYDKPQGFRAYYSAVRWQPPDIHAGQCTPDKMSDVWSLGVTLWEIFAKGEKPFATLSQTEIVAEVEGGKGLEQPGHATEAIFDLMKECWFLDKKQRITAAQLRDAFSEMIPEDGAGLPGGAAYQHGAKRSTKTASLRSHVPPSKRSMARRASLPSELEEESTNDRAASVASVRLPSIADSTPTDSPLAERYAAETMSPSSDSSSGTKLQACRPNDTPSRNSTAPLLPNNFPVDGTYQESTL